MTVSRNIQIAVVGASLGGLSAANVLRQLGFDVQVFELFPKGFETRGGALGSVDLNLLRQIRGGDHAGADRSIKGHGHFYGDLWEYLYQGLPTDSVHFGVDVQTLADAGGARPSLVIDSKPKAFDLIIGADGGKSTIRPFVSDQQPIYSGYTVCRHRSNRDILLEGPDRGDEDGPYGTPTKPLATFAERWDRFRRSSRSKNVVVVGGGIAGAELSLAMAHALAQELQQANVTLVDRSTLLSSSSRVAQRRIRRSLAKYGVTVLENTRVQKVLDTLVELDDSTAIKANFVVGAAGATPLPWLPELGLELHKGQIVVDEALQTSIARVFAVGDCAHLGFDPRPKAGVYAVRQAPVLLENLRRVLNGGDLLPYVPQKDYLKLISLGAKRAFGEKGGVGLAGSLVWRLKGRIDQEFMRQFR